MRVWNLGYPRMGRARELKLAVESFWAGKLDAESLLEQAKRIMAARWCRQHDLGVESIPLNDFSLYDHVLDMAFLLGAIPERFQGISFGSWVSRYFAIARGCEGIPPLQMTKWFNTNYHYLVPEISPSLDFVPRCDKFLFELEHARAYPFVFHPVLIGPWTFVKLSRLVGLNLFDGLDRVLPPYEALLLECKVRGFTWLQMDEPALCLEPSPEEFSYVAKTYERLGRSGVKLRLATYFESPDPWLSELSRWPVEGLHFDCVSAPGILAWLKKKEFPKDKSLSVGIVDGRNIWAAPLDDCLGALRELAECYDRERVWLAPSCPLLHLPEDKSLEKTWDAEFLEWVSFADQRIEELVILKQACSGDGPALKAVEYRREVIRRRSASPRVRSDAVRQAASVARARKGRSPFALRHARQKKSLNLPLLPTTTIGSFPQTAKIRERRSLLKSGKLSMEQYQKLIEEEIARVIHWQEEVGLDVLVHGESERNDMAEYFAERLEGFVVSSHGWVQSYGSRLVKPPIIFGDVRRVSPMTVPVFRHAQGLTRKPVKGVLTGPVTLLNWSFVREDLPLSDTVFQIAAALADEALDLEKAGAQIIQIDEAAFREGFPLKRDGWSDYLKWATEAFRVCVSGLKDETQVHAHMCYSKFDDMADALEALDCDVLLIECARSGGRARDLFGKHKYSKGIGPGVYDVHSPRAPSEEEFQQRIESNLDLFSADQLWVNPDCGLKTRGYEEIEPALSRMVAAAHVVRERLKKAPCEGVAVS